MTEVLQPLISLRKPSEFRVVYQNGRCYDGRLISAFIVPNGLEYHRVGITVSRKVSRKAVDRNRAKRLIREACRISIMSSNNCKYDWVLNAKRSLLSVKVECVTAEMRKVITQLRLVDL